MTGRGQDISNAVNTLLTQQNLLIISSSSVKEQNKFIHTSVKNIDGKIIVLNWDKCKFYGLLKGKGEQWTNTSNSLLPSRSATQKPICKGMSFSVITSLTSMSH
jgi:hypothetical protein